MLHKFQRFAVHAGLATLLLAPLASCLSLLSPGPSSKQQNGYDNQASADFHRSIDKGLYGEARVLCKTPPEKTIGNKKWVGKKVSAEACEWLKSHQSGELNSIVRDAEKLGGGGCFSLIWANYSGTYPNGSHVFPFESPEARGDILLPVADACITQLTSWQAEGNPGAAYMSMASHMATLGQTDAETFPDDTQTDRMKEQMTQVRSIWETVSNEAAESFFQRGKKLQRTDHLAAAFYFAAAAGVFDARQEDGGAKLLALGQSELRKAQSATTLVVSATGSGLAAQAIADAKERRLSGVSYGNPGSNGMKLSMELGKPTIDMGVQSVTLNASYEEANGTKTNPAYEKKAERCREYEAAVKSGEKSCAEDNKGCDFIEMRQGSLDSCESSLSRMKETIPATKTIKVDYLATRNFGVAMGKAILKIEGRKEPVQLTIEGSREGFTHAAVPAAGIEAKSSKPKTESEMQRAYIVKAGYVLSKFLEKEANALLGGMLETVRASKTPDELASNFVAYYAATNITRALYVHYELETLAVKNGLPLYKTIVMLIPPDEQ